MNATRLHLGDRVVDVYSDDIGTITMLNDHRCTVKFEDYVLTGCPSWFDPAPGPKP